jgi:hypothetical protein
MAYRVPMDQVRVGDRIPKYNATVTATPADARGARDQAVLAYDSGKKPARLPGVGRRGNTLNANYGGPSARMPKIQGRHAALSTAQFGA